MMLVPCQQTGTAPPFIEAQKPENEARRILSHLDAR
jgi:hypothetical protein